MAASCDDLGAFLQDRLCAHTNLPVFVHILTDYHKPTQLGDEQVEYSHVEWKHERLYRKRLILVFQKSVLVIGMSVQEYCRKANNSAEMTRSYIQYIDTTGLYQPRQYQSQLTKSLVSAYISYCHQQLRCASIHLMASAKPSFLFAGSEFNESKGRLSTAKLVKWWIAVIEQSCEHIPSRVRVWSPGEDVAEDSRTADRIQRRQNVGGSIDWQYGPFFEPNDRICDIVPLLEDDPKLKHFMSFFEDVHKDNTKMDNLKCKNFVDTLGLRPEFRNQCHSTLFMIEFTDLNQDKVIAQIPEKTTQLAAFAAKMLSNLTIESEAKCVDASGKITSWLKFMGSKPLGIKTVMPEAVIEKSQNVQTDTPPVDLENAVNVQGLIKKRRSIVTDD